MKITLEHRWSTDRGRSFLVDGMVLLSNNPEECFVLGSDRYGDERLRWERFDLRTMSATYSEHCDWETSSRISEVVQRIRDTDKLCARGWVPNAGEYNLRSFALGATKSAFERDLRWDPSSLAWCPDGKFLVRRRTDGTLTVFALNDDPLWECESAGLVGDSLAVCSGGGKIAFSGEAGKTRSEKVFVATKENPKPVQVAAPGEFESLCFTLDGTGLWIVQQERLVFVSLSERREVTIPLPGEAWLQVLALASDGSVLVCGKALYAVSAQGLMAVTDRSWVPISPSVSPDGKRAGWLRGSAFVVASLETGEEQQWSEGHESAVWSFGIAPGGKRFSTASADGTIRLWDVETRETRAMFECGERVFDAVWSRDGTLLYSLGQSHRLRVWDLYSLAEQTPEPALLMSGNGLRISPDGTYASVSRVADDASGTAACLVLLSSMSIVPVDKRVFEEVPKSTSDVFGNLDSLACLSCFSSDGKQWKLLFPTSEERAGAVSCVNVECASGQLFSRSRESFLLRDTWLVDTSHNGAFSIVCVEYGDFTRKEANVYAVQSVETKQELWRFSASWWRDGALEKDWFAVAAGVLLLFVKGEQHELTLPDRHIANSVAWLPLEGNSRTLLVGTENGQVLSYTVTR